MNLVDCVVTEVLSEPYFNYMWCVDVKSNSYGRISETTVHLKTEDEAKKVQPGYKYLA